MQALERLGVAELARDAYRDLSGGEKQRVLMARALVSQPDVLVLDEPTEGIDLAGEADMMDFLGELHRQGELALIMIEHHMTDVISIVDHLCLINQHTGLFEAGPIAELLTEQRLGQLYQRPVEIDACAERTHVHVRGRGRDHD
jgi:ABC-type Mn2+/Zn2+ transport system ATPase subunit